MKEKSEVRQVGEREIWVGESRFYLDEDNILYITSVGEFDDETAIANKKAFLKLLNMAKGNLKQLIDLNKSGKSSVQARKTCSFRATPGCKNTRLIWYRSYK